MRLHFGLSLLLLLLLLAVCAFCGLALDRDAVELQVGQGSRKLLENNVKSLAKDGIVQVQVKKEKDKAKGAQLSKVKAKATKDQNKKVEETAKGSQLKVDPLSAGKSKNKKKLVEEEEDEDLRFIEEERLTTGKVADGSSNKKSVKAAEDDQQKSKVNGKKKTKALKKEKQDIEAADGEKQPKDEREEQVKDESEQLKDKQVKDEQEQLEDDQFKDEPEQLKNKLDGEKQLKDELDGEEQPKGDLEGEKQVGDGLDGEQEMEQGKVKAQSREAEEDKIEVEQIQDGEEFPVDKADATVLADDKQGAVDDREIEATLREEAAEEQLKDVGLPEKKTKKVAGTGRPDKKTLPSKKTPLKTKAKPSKEVDNKKTKPTAKSMGAVVDSKAGKPKKGKELENIKMGTDKSKEVKGTKEMPINFGAEDAEDLQTDAGLPTKSGTTDVLMTDESKDEDEDEDINLLDEFTALPTKIQQTAGHVAETLRPGFEKISEKSKGYFTHANKQMTESLTPLMGDQVAPVVASLISYALLLVPLIVVLYMLERIRASLSLAKVLFFVNLYLAAYFLTLVLATFALDGEPMAFFFKNARSSYIFLQLLQAFGYCFYFLLYAAVFVKSCSSEGILMRILAAFQLVVVSLFGLHYYVTVFHRAMAVKIPRTSWKLYLVYSGAFAVLCLVARAKIERTKKEYYYNPTDDPDEAVPVDKRS